MSIYTDWGFTGNPFQTTVLTPDELGEGLLIGRDKELGTLKKRILNPPRLPTLEGMNGVGKTSLVNVAAYKCYQDFLRDPDKPLLIPCRKIFQLRPDQSLEDFIGDVYREVAQTLIEKAREIEGCRFEGNEKQGKIEKWLNAPQLSGFQVGLASVTGGYSSETNTGEGFTRSGFPKVIRDWLNSIFPTQQDGGVVCVIDNLELLQTSEQARQQIEALRDELLLLPGLRWVLCGALGIVLGIASSPRMEGFLNTPIEIRGIDKQFVGEIYDSRVRIYAEINDPYLPLSKDDFEKLYSILFFNLRSLLGHADDYCQWIADNVEPKDEDEKRKEFDVWLTEISSKAFESAKAQLRPRAWRVFEDAIAIDGSFSPSDFEHFRFKSIPAFRPHVRDLEAAGLVVSTQDDGDKRRKTAQITPRGWLVNEYMKRTS